MHGRIVQVSSMIRGNALLSALAPSDALLVAQHLVRRELPAGATLIAADKPVERIWFPETAVISLSASVPGQSAIDVGLIGREGMIGWSVLLGSDKAGYGSTVLLGGGSMLSIGAAPLRAACAASPTLLTGLLRFVDLFVEQMVLTIIATGSYSAERRLARWLLMLHDRVDGDELSIKHSELGTLLNLRRATITDCLHVLEGERALRCSRGRIVVRDRAVLEACAGDAYGRSEQRYRDVLGSFGKGERSALAMPCNML